MTAARVLELRHAEPEGHLTARQVADLLGIGLRTFYRIQWFKSRKVRPTDSVAPNATVRYRRSDVALYQSLRRGG